MGGVLSSLSSPTSGTGSLLKAGLSGAASGMQKQPQITPGAAVNPGPMPQQVDPGYFKPMTFGQTRSPIYG